MTATLTPFSRNLAPLLLGLGAALAAGNWYLAPGRAGSWLAALLFLTGLALVLSFARLVLGRSSQPADGRRAASIRHAIAFAAAMIALPLTAKLAYALGAVGDAALSQRLAMVVLGGFLVFTGNALPKMLTPLSALRCDGSRVQALQRFAGLTQVLTGLAFAVVWLVLPPDTAEPISVALVVGGSLVVMARVIGLRRTHQKEA